MNKANKLILAGLMFCGVNSAFSMGNEQMDILKTLLKLGQNFADVPMITQNIDMFMGVTEMNIQILEADLKVANQKLKTVLLKNTALFTGALFGKTMVINIARGKGFRPSKFVGDLFINGGRSLGALVGTLNALNIYDVWKHRSELLEALALDKEILSKLQEIKDSSDQSSGSEQVEKLL